jgi:hypothetical protein
VDKIVMQGNSLDKSLTFHKNYPTEHQYKNTECGMYSLFFVITMLTEKTEVNGEKDLTLEQKINLFMKEKIPDEYVFQYRDIYFGA